MILLWTKSNKPGSKLIRWGLNEPTSHFAIAFYPERSGGLVCHQRIMGGFNIDWFPQFLNENEIVYALKPKAMSIEKHDRFFKLICQEFSHTDYDIMSITYFSWRVLLKKLTGEPIPNKSRWGNSEDPLCTGHARVLQEIEPSWFSERVRDFDIITPKSLYENMRRSNKFSEGVEWLP